MRKLKDIIVKKYGGSSLKNLARIKKVAENISCEKDNHTKLIIVVSAMGNETDYLIKSALEISKYPSQRELDMLISTGEQKTIALLSMALLEQGLTCASYTGGQIGIYTDDNHTEARIIDIDIKKIHNALKTNDIIIVAGFQGINSTNEITTLGRGGSDTTAVAIAAAVNAKVCQIYTDVNGLYTTDPRLIKEARQIPRINYRELLTFSSRGAKIMHPRSVEIAINYNVPLEILSTFEGSKNSRGTQVYKEEIMENFRIKGITLENNITHFALKDLHLKDFDCYEFLSLLNNQNIPVDMIFQNSDQQFIKEISFITEKNHSLKVLATCKDYLNIQNERSLITSKHQSVLSVIGYGINKHPEVTAKIFSVLKTHQIMTRQVSTSESSISFIIDSSMSPMALNLLHSKLL